MLVKDRRGRFVQDFSNLMEVVLEEFRISSGVVGVIASTYLFLRLLLRLTQDAKEPPAILTALPFVSPLLGMVREKSRFHIRLRLV